MKKLLLLLALALLALGCNANPKAQVFAASGGTRPPPINPYWTQAAWFLDPANVTTTASDQNDCKTPTTPCLHWYEMNARWGCIGGMTACPQFQQTTAITNMSTQPSGGVGDAVVFQPQIQGNFGLSLTGLLNAGTLRSSGTLTVNSSQNKATPTTLTVTPSGATALFDLIIDASQPGGCTLLTTCSRAVIGEGSTGSGLAVPWEMAQPLTTTATVGAVPAEQNTWTTGDSYSEFQQPGLNIVRIRATVADQQSNDTTPSPLVVDGLTFLDPGLSLGLDGGAAGSSGFYKDSVEIDGPVIVADSTFYKKVVTQTSGYTPSARFVDNNYVQGAHIGVVNGIQQLTVTNVSVPPVVPWPAVWGGYFFNPIAPTSSFEADFGNVWLDLDVILPHDEQSTVFTGTVLYGSIAWDTVPISSSVLLYSAFMRWNRGFFAQPIIWNHGGNAVRIKPWGPSKITYVGSAVATFLHINLLDSDDDSTACSWNGIGVYNSSQFCNINLSATTLDNAAVDAGGCAGFCFTPAGSSYRLGN